MCASGAVVVAWSLLIRRLQRARRQAETPPIVLCRFPGPALTANFKEDLAIFGAKLPPPSFLFVTISAQPNKLLNRFSMEDRRKWFEEQLSPFAAGLTNTDFDDEQFRFTIAKLLLKVIRFAFHTRTDAQFTPVLKLIYRDSVWMTTIGGLLGEQQLKETFEQAVHTKLGFLLPEGELFYEVPQFNVSESERRLLDRAATHSNQKNPFTAQLKRIGFDDLFIQDYQNLIRFIPRYHETFI